MLPLCNYNNNDDDDFVTEYVIQDANTQLLFFSLLLFLHGCQGLFVVRMTEEQRTIFLLRVIKLHKKK